MLCRGRATRCGARRLLAAALILALAGCTYTYTNPLTDQMDAFFRSLRSPRTHALTQTPADHAPPNPETTPGYAPPYPPYSLQSDSVVFGPPKAEQ